MLTLSKFHDYYDGVANTAGIDKTIVFRRISKEFELEGELPYLYYPSPFPIVTAFVIGFCGKTYKGVEVITREPDKKEFLYGEEAIKILTKISELRDYVIQQLVRSGWSRSSLYKVMTRVNNKTLNFWKDFEYKEEDYRKYNTPIIALRDGRYNTMVEIVNPELRRFGFQKIIDPYTAYQEIQMYISGVLGRGEKDTVEVSDKVRLEGHGFDPKWSFRQPENRKKRKRTRE